MTDETFPTGNRGAESTSPARRRIELSASQWTTLVVMGGMLLAIGGILVWVLRAGVFGGSVDVWATVIAGPTFTPTPPRLVRDAVPTPSGLFWPPRAQPLATPNAPSDLLWWNAQFAYRRPILLDAVASEAPRGTWVRVIFDGETVRRDGKMRADGADLRVLVWDGANWWELPRRAQSRIGEPGWDVVFHLQDAEVARSGGYYLYYGNPFAEHPPIAEDALEASRLLLSLGKEEGVEWGPQIAWTANSTTTQTIVSPDGRVVIQCPPGGPREDVRVRLRSVPAGEKNSSDPSPDFELHADPPPGPPGPSNVAHWDPPLTVIINWAGLPVDVDDLERWSHYAHDEATGSWYKVTVDVDRKRGLTRVTTDQP